MLNMLEFCDEAMRRKVLALFLQMRPIPALDPPT